MSTPTTHALVRVDNPSLGLSKAFEKLDQHLARGVTGNWWEDYHVFGGHRMGLFEFLDYRPWLDALPGLIQVLLPRVGRFKRVPRELRSGARGLPEARLLRTRRRN